MILFCRDPQGETIIAAASPMQSALASVTVPVPPHQMLASTNKEFNAKITTLERAMDGKDKTIIDLLERIQDLTQKV